MSGPGGDSVVRLRDGRQLGYATYGDPAGFPVLSCHGGLLCRLDASPVDEPARDLGARVISPDRPGVGLSDRLPGHSTLDWASDAEQLLDQLGIDRFACTGWSMGGQYCAAVSFRMASRVTRAVIVAGCLPLDEPGLVDQLSRTDRVLGGLSVKSPRAARAALVTLRLGARFVEKRQGLPHRALAEGLRNPSGVVDEYRAFRAPWGFRLEDVRVPTEVWQGTADELVPPEWATEIVLRVPSSTLVSLEGEGHMIGITRRAEVLRRLVETAEPV